MAGVRTAEILYKVDFSASGGPVYDNIAGINTFDPTQYLNVPLPANLNGFTISVRFIENNSPYTFQTTPYPLPPDLSFTCAPLGDVTTGEVNAGDNTVVDFFVMRSSAIPMPMTYTFADSDDTFTYTNLSPIYISYGNVTVSTTTPSITDVSTGIVNVRLYNSINTSVPWIPSSLISGNVQAQIQGNVIKIYDDQGGSSSWGYNPSAGDTYSNSVITYHVTNTHARSSSNTVIKYTPFAKYNVGLLLRYPNAGSSASITYTPTTVIPPNPGAPCFLGYAPVLTPFGYQRIDSLKKNDMIISTGGIVPIINVNEYKVDASRITNPYIIPVGKFKAIENILISPNHCVKVDGKMIPAKNLGLEQQDMSGQITYYNIELEDWHNMFVAGVEVETLAPTKWVTITQYEFNQAVKAQCGEMTAKLQKIINSKVKFLDNGMVECPIFRRV